jgi:glycosyltransferase involved in cell wall biosynthesis
MMADGVTFSVIIPTYNRSELLRDALASLEAQSVPASQVIVVDDGSADDTPHVVAQAARPPVFLHQSRLGPGAARNRGLAEVSGEYVVFLDSDDVLLPWALETYAQTVLEHGRPAIIIASAAPFRLASELARVVREPSNANVFPDYYAASSLTMWHGASVIVARTDALRAVGGFTDEWVNAEDSDLMMRLGVSPGLVFLDTPRTVGYRLHADSAVANIERTARGVTRLVRCETTRDYPGGALRRLERRRILTRHSRACSLACIKAGRFRDACWLYGQTLMWNLRLGHLRYVIGFPFVALAKCFQLFFSRLSR